jgi:hypothetical protein
MGKKCCKKIKIKKLNLCKVERKVEKFFERKVEKKFDSN